jgi:hypothetical protein
MPFNFRIRGHGIAPRGLVRLGSFFAWLVVFKPANISALTRARGQILPPTTFAISTVLCL